MKFTPIILLAVMVSWMASCSGSSEATSRKDLEIEFANAFGFAPSSAIASIKYSDLYNRGAMDGSYGQWLCFTYESAAFDKIILAGYKEDKIAEIPNNSVSPAWWQKTLPKDAVVYSRTQDDTPTNEGYSFREYIWHDKASGLVYFQKSYWD